MGRPVIESREVGRWRVDDVPTVRAVGLPDESIVGTTRAEAARAERGAEHTRGFVPEPSCPRNNGGRVGAFREM